MIDVLMRDVSNGGARDIREKNSRMEKGDVCDIEEMRWNECGIAERKKSM